VAANKLPGEGAKGVRRPGEGVKRGGGAVVVTVAATSRKGGGWLDGGAGGRRAAADLTLAPSFISLFASYSRTFLLLS
jgi:hypothetical protein